MASASQTSFVVEGDDIEERDLLKYLRDEFQLGTSFSECLLCHSAGPSKNVARLHRNVARCVKFWQENNAAKRIIISRCLVSRRSVPLKSIVHVQEFQKTLAKAASCKVCVWAVQNLNTSDLTVIDQVHRDIDKCYRKLKRKNFDEKQKAGNETKLPPQAQIEAKSDFKKCKEENFSKSETDIQKLGIEGNSLEGQAHCIVENVPIEKSKTQEVCPNDAFTRKRIFKSKDSTSSHDTESQPNEKKIKVSVPDDDAKVWASNTENTKEFELNVVEAYGVSKSINQSVTVNSGCVEALTSNFRIRDDDFEMETKENCMNVSSENGIDAAGDQCTDVLLDHDYSTTKGEKDRQRTKRANEGGEGLDLQSLLHPIGFEFEVMPNPLHMEQCNDQLIADGTRMFVAMLSDDAVNYSNATNVDKANLVGADEKENTSTRSHVEKEPEPNAIVKSFCGESKALETTDLENSSIHPEQISPKPSTILKSVLMQSDDSKQFEGTAACNLSANQASPPNPPAPHTENHVVPSPPVFDQIASKKLTALHLRPLETVPPMETVASVPATTKDSSIPSNHRILHPVPASILHSMPSNTPIYIIPSSSVTPFVPVSTEKPEVPLCTAMDASAMGRSAAVIKQSSNLGLPDKALPTTTDPTNRGWQRQEQPREFENSDVTPQDPRSLLVTDNFKYSDNILNLFLERGCRRYQMSINMNKGRRNQVSTTECRVCKAHISNARLAMHLKSKHSMEAAFMCPRCQVKFMFRDELFDHMEKLHPQFMFQFEAIYPKKQFQDSQQINSTITPEFKNPLFNKFPDGDQDQSAHEKPAIPIQMEARSREIDVSTCVTCHKMFSNQYFLDRHIRSAHLSPPVAGASDHVNLPTTSTSAGSMHAKNFHTNLSFPCNFCEQIFDRRDLLFRHKKETHIPECRYCGKILSRFSSLNRHELTHGLHNGAPLKAIVKPKKVSESSKNDLKFMNEKIYSRSFDQVTSKLSVRDDNRIENLHSGVDKEAKVEEEMQKSLEENASTRTSVDAENKVFQAIESTAALAISSQSSSIGNNENSVTDEIITDGKSRRDILEQAMRDADIDPGLFGHQNISKIGVKPIDKNNAIVSPFASDIQTSRKRVEEKDSVRDAENRNENRDENQSESKIAPESTEVSSKDKSRLTVKLRIKIPPQKVLTHEEDAEQNIRDGKAQMLEETHEVGQTVAYNSPNRAIKRLASPETENKVSSNTLLLKSLSPEAPNLLESHEENQRKTFHASSSRNSLPDEENHGRKSGHQCRVCSKFFMTEKNLKLHVLVEHNPSHKCNSSKLLQTQNALLSHVKSVHNAKPEQCDDPRQNISKKSERHLIVEKRKESVLAKPATQVLEKCQIYSDGKKFHCSTCRLSFQTRVEMRSHLIEMK